MDSIGAIETRRQRILEQLASIRSLCPATLTEQMLPVRHKGRAKPVLRGPYYLLARWENGKTRSRRVRKEELPRVRHDIDNHKRFLALCKELESLTEQLGALESQASASEEPLKKGLKSRSSRTRK